MLDLAHMPQAVLVDEALQHLQLPQRRVRPDDDAAKDVLHIGRQLWHQHFRENVARHGLDHARRPRDHLGLIPAPRVEIAEPQFLKTLQSLRPKAFEQLPEEVKELGPSYRAANPAGVAEWKKRHERAGTRSPVRLRNTITWDLLAMLRVPALLMTGDADLWIPPYLLRQVGERIPNSTVVIVPDCGHAVQWEQPEMFNDAVLDFIRTKARG